MTEGRLAKMAMNMVPGGRRAVGRTRKIGLQEHMQKTQTQATASRKKGEADSFGDVIARSIGPDRIMQEVVYFVKYKKILVLYIFIYED